MRIGRRSVKGFAVISLTGDMDPYDAEAFEDSIVETIENNQKNIIIDLQGLLYISSSGLRALLGIRSRLLREGGRLFLTSLKGRVLEVFRTSKLLEVFSVYKDVEEALKA